MNLTTITGWIDKEQVSLTKVFARVESLAAQAEPIVAELSTIEKVAASTLADGSTLKKIAGYLVTITNDADRVALFIEANSGVSVGTLLRNAATFALSFISGGSALASDLGLAVELAHSINKQNKLALN